MANTFTLSGTSLDAENNPAYAGRYMVLRVTSVGTDTEDAASYPQDSVSALIGTDGTWSFTTLWVNGDSGILSYYEMKEPSGQRVEFVFPSGVEGTTVRYEFALENYLAADAEEQVAPALGAHIADLGNPHQVTADQVSLGATDDVTFNTITTGRTASSSIYSIDLATDTGFRGIGAGSQDFGYYRSGVEQWSADSSGVRISQPLTLGTDLAVTEGGTGASNAADARTNLGVFEDGDTQNYVQFDTAPATPVYTAARLYFNDTEKSLKYDTGVSDVTNSIGEELYAPLVTNSTGVQIDNGKVVRLNATGTIQLAQSDTRANSNGTIGLATHDIADAAQGKITTYGLVNGVDTSTYSVGDTLYLSSTSAGGYTDEIPQLPIQLGTVWSSHATTGQIFVRIEDLRIASNIPFYKEYSFTTQGIGNGTFWTGGFYDAPATDSNLTQASTTQTYGSANGAYAAHAFLVAGGVGTASGGAGPVTIVVSGTSFTSAGVRTPGDSEVIVTDIAAMSTDAYYETSKKWLGTVTYTLTVGATAHTLYAADFNYGFAKYDDFGNRNFTVTDFEAVGLAGATDTGYGVTLYHHNDTGWTYAATGFEPGGVVLASSATDLSTDGKLWNTENFSYKRTGLSTPVSGIGLEGTVVKIITTTNNALEILDIHVGATL